MKSIKKGTGTYDEVVLESHACWSLAESRAAVVKEEVSRPHDLNLNVVDVLSVIPHDRERIPWEGEFTIC